MELLTTGQMIDRLKVGESAICELREATLEVIKTRQGEIKHKKSENGFLNMSFNVHNKWTISPNYVSFAEAMKAVEEDKDVECNFNGNIIKFKTYKNKINEIREGESYKSGGGTPILLAWVCAGKWSIIE